MVFFGVFSLFIFLFVCPFYVCFLCVCVWGCVGVFLTGGGYVLLCSCTKDKNSIKECVVCYSASNYGTYFLITGVYCGFRKNKKRKKYILIPARAQ